MMGEKGSPGLRKAGEQPQGRGKVGDQAGELAFRWSDD